MVKKVPVTKKVLADVTTKKKVVKKTPVPENRIMFVLDDSGSMRSVADSAITAFNEIYETVREKSKEHGQLTTVSLCKFGETFEFPYLGVSCDSVPKLGYNNYSPWQCLTRLYDAIGKSIEKLESGRDSDKDNVSFLLIVTTDGYNNSTRAYTPDTLKKLISKVMSTDRWSIVIQVPPGSRDRIAAQLGISVDNVIEWSNTKESVEKTSVATRKGLGLYFDARSRGVKSVSNFYVTTDLSKVNKRTLNSKLDDLSDDFKTYVVSKEMEIEPFVTEKTKRPYVRGEAFYQLMKKETVQPDKEVLIVDKKDNKVYGGQQARDLIGLPQSGNARVTPGLHNDKEIYIASKSTNRKLPRGTKVMIKKS